MGLGLVVAAAVCLTLGCKKEDPAGGGPPPSTPPKAAPGDPVGGDDGDEKRDCAVKAGGGRDPQEMVRELEGGNPGDLERGRAIQRCASCHAREYESWKKGPHAFSHTAVVRQYTWASDPSSPLSDTERQFVRTEGDAKGICCACHCPTRNVFEGSVDVGEAGIRDFDFGHLCVRRDEPMLTHGVDCLTCHARKEQVVARADYRPGGPHVEGCDILPSTTFSHIASCAPCHPQGDSYVARFDPSVEGERPFVHCNECHMEKDAAGEPTHYYYWSSGEKKFARLVRPAFDTLAFGVAQAGGKKELTVHWVHDFAPHGLVPTTPRMYLLRLDVLGATGQVVHTEEIRFYSAEEDPPKDQLRRHNPVGELATLAAGATFERRYPLPDTVPAAGSVRLTVRQKAKFDYADTQVRLVMEKVQPYAL